MPKHHFDFQTDRQKKSLNKRSNILKEIKKNLVPATSNMCYQFAGVKQIAIKTMSPIQFLDDLIREYLLFRGFVNTLKLFDGDVKAEKDKGLRSDK